MTHDVFISYSHHDKSAADAVCAKLEQHGIRCWIAPRDVEPGTEWAGSIIHAISNSKIMVLVFSNSANNSPQIRKEVERAVNKGVIVVPLRIEDVVPTESLEYFMSNVHWLDALTPPLEKHLDHLAGTVKIMLERIESRDEPTPHPPVHEPSLEAPSEPITPSESISRDGMALAEIEVQSTTASTENESSRMPSEKSRASHSRKLRLPAGVLAGATLLIILLVVIYFARKTPPPPQFVHQYDLEHAFPFSSAVFSVAFSPDGHSLASGGTNASAEIWDVSTGTRLRTLEPFPGFVASVAFSPDGRWLASGTSNHTIKLWDLATGQLARTLPIPSSFADPSVAKQWLDAMNNTPKTPPASSPAKPPSFTLEPEEPVHNGPFGNQFVVLTLFLSSDYIDSVAFSPDSRWVASGSAKDNTVELWDAATGTLLRKLTGHTKSVTTVAFNPKGNLLASASADKIIKIWDPAAGKIVCTLSGHTDGVRGVAFSPDGRWLASASDDHTVKLWDVTACREIRTLSGHTESVHAVAFSPDGLWLASGGADQIVKLWNSSTGKEVATLKYNSKWIESIAFSPDGHTLATGNQGGQAVLWHRTN
jgi:WD40 repeat protein